MTAAETAPTQANDTKAGRRGLTVAMTLCAVCGGGVLLAIGRAWVHFSERGQPLVLHASGYHAANVSGTPALVVLAGVVALPATRGIGRRVIGLLVALVALDIVYSCAHVLASPGTNIASAGAGAVVGARVTAWPWVALCVALLGVAAGVLTAVASRYWPSMGRRYEVGGTKRATVPADVSMWDRLDEGDDPTT